jgi:hypothetical protein
MHQYLTKAIQDDAQRAGERGRLLLEAQRAHVRRRPRGRRRSSQAPGPAAISPSDRLAQQARAPAMVVLTRGVARCSRRASRKETTVRNDSSRHSDEVGQDAPGSGLRVRPPAHPIAAQAVGPDAARETSVGTKPPEGRGSAGLTEGLAAACARRARRALAAEVRK